MKAEEINLKQRYYAMIQRCLNANNAEYHNYGARGITICDEWFHNEEAFIQWSLNNGFEMSLQIDRTDNDGPYSPENCRWVTAQVNSRNRRDNTTNWEKGTRICSYCNVEKPLTEFHRSSKKGNSGHTYVCKACVRLYRSLKSYRTGNIS